MCIQNILLNLRVEVFIEAHWGWIWVPLISSSCSTLIGEVVDCLLLKELRPRFLAHTVIGNVHIIIHIYS